MFGFTLAIATATGVVFGLVPALQASRPDLVPMLKGIRAAEGRRGLGLRGALVVTQVALSVILLVAAGLCVKTLQQRHGDRHRLRRRERLDRADRSRQAALQRGARTLLQQQLLARLEDMPGVAAAGFAVTLPLNDGRWESPVRREGDPTRMQTFQNVVSPRYFDAMNIPRASLAAASPTATMGRRRAWRCSTRRSRGSCGRTRARSASA